jgi:hypothetical protein
MKHTGNVIILTCMALRCTEELAPFLEKSGGELYLNAMHAGYISLHADLLVHGSQPNHSPRRRCGTRRSRNACRTASAQAHHFEFLRHGRWICLRLLPSALPSGFTLRYCASDCVPVGWGNEGKPKGYGGQAILCRGGIHRAPSSCLLCPAVATPSLAWLLQIEPHGYM